MAKPETQADLTHIAPPKRMIFAEVAVNVPIRPTFSRRVADPPPEPDIFGAAPDDFDAPTAANVLQQQNNDPARGLQTFHYHLPAALENTIQPGHLVWVPFGSQEVQGIVLQRSEEAPVATKPILRLARPDPILSPTQIALAGWIAHRYLAPLSEALKLFLPPGLLTKQKGEERRTGAKARHELQIELLVDTETIATRLPTLGRDTQQAQIVAWLLDHPDQRTTAAELQERCAIKSASAIKTLLDKGVIESIDDGIQITGTPATARRTLLELRGAAKFEPILQALAQANAPLWKSDLYTLVDADLNTLRTLQTAGLVQLTEKVRFRDPLAGRTYARTTPPPLTGDQQQAWDTIERRAFAPRADRDHATLTPSSPPHFLIHGVTGSGKTEIYLRAIAHTLARGQQAIVLIPEIALTPQTVARFAGRFPDRVTVIHSELSQGERYDVWRHIRSGDFDVVVGPRSALFAPMPRLGLIIIDEEHETSYKQNAEAWGSFTVFYDARTVAQRLAELTNSVLILGSATPSLESYHAAVTNITPQQFTLLEMPRRVLGHRAPREAAPAPLRELSDQGALTTAASPSAQSADSNLTLYAELPPVEIIDMRQELRAGNRSIFSRTLAAELHSTLDAGEQAILFLNRRGTNTFILCRDCGHVEKCKYCDTPLTFHERAAVLICHHCNRRSPIPTICPECNSKRIKYFGSGTQRIEELVHEIVPHARLLRWDADTTGRKGQHEEILRQFAQRQADILVGTQMIAKGLDLPMVTLVGAISADTGLFLPDFRSGERTFQLLTQVAGRAGRGERGGRVVIQTYTPEHYAIQAAARHDFHAFYEREIAFRREHGYPPIQRLLRLIYWDKKLAKVEEATTAMAATLRHRVGEMGVEGNLTSIMGPAPAFFARFRGYYRWQIVLRAPDPAAVLRGLPIPFGWRVDVDPVSML